MTVPPLENWRDIEAWLAERVRANPQMWYTVTYTYTTDSTVAPDSKTYSQGFDDGWNARGAADGKP